MHVVIPLSAVTDNNFLELRFALRGIAQHVQAPEITLIGACPKWCKGVNHIPATDSPETMWRDRNIFRKLLLAPYPDFLYANDDHFLTAPWTGEYYHNGRLDKLLNTLVRGSIYRKTVLNTTMIYPRAQNFDVHCPMPVNRAALHRIDKPYMNKPYSVCMKTVYCMSNNIEGLQCDDLKIRKAVSNLPEVVAGRGWFSAADGVWTAEMKDAMKQLFPVKSPWE